MDQTAFVGRRKDSHHESVKAIEESIMGYLGFLRKSENLYLKNVDKYRELKYHFEHMDDDEAFEYARNAMLFPENIEKIYRVDVGRIFAEMDKSYWYSNQSWSAQNIELSYGFDQPIYTILDTEKNRKLAIDVVNSIKASPRLPIRKD